MSNWLHIVNGSTTANGLRRAGIPGTISEFADVLHEGPVVPDDDIDAWLYTRAVFAAECGWGGMEEVLQLLRAWQQSISGFRNYDDVILWYEHDLFDQLLLIRHLSWWWHNAPLDPPTLVSPADYLGAMNADELRAQLDVSTRATEMQMVLAADVWHAFTQGDPSRLVRIVTRENLSPLPHLHGALLRLLQEYPSTFNGVGRTEQQILELLARAPRTAHELFLASQQLEERVFMGDSVFFLRLQPMLHSARPLLLHEREHDALAVTDDGRAVLEGSLDNVALNGIDRWIGGVRLTPDHLWRWDGARLVSA